MKKEKNTNFNKGFTLIELLVVVLIMGVLAAIALPQYKRAFIKSKAAQMYDAVAAMARSAQTFYMVQGEWPIAFNELDINYEGPKTDFSICLNSTIYGEVILKDDLEYIIHKGSSSNPYNHISVRFIEGPYKCTGFAFFLSYKENPSLQNRLLCYERTDTSVRGVKNEIGDFCEKIMGYNSYYQTSRSSVYYY